MCQTNLNVIKSDNRDCHSDILDFLEEPALDLAKQVANLVHYVLQCLVDRHTQVTPRLSFPIKAIVSHSAHTCEVHNVQIKRNNRLTSLQKKNNLLLLQ